MNTPLVSYERQGKVAFLRMDDGKANAMSPAMLHALNQALDRAEREQVVVVLTGRDGMFSGGFDLKVLNAGRPDAFRMLYAGFRLPARLLSFPAPIVIACNGHALAMGLFTALCGDYRVGVQGDYQLAANEVAVGLPVPRVVLQVCRHRLQPGHFPRVMLLSEYYNPEQAIAAGMLDQIVPADELETVAREKALALAELDWRAYRMSKRRIHGRTVRAIRRAIWPDMLSVFLEGMHRMAKKRAG